MAMDFYSQISSNKKMTVLLFIAFFILLGILAGIISLLLGGLNIYACAQGAGKLGKGGGEVVGDPLVCAR